MIVETLKRNPATTRAIVLVLVLVVVALLGLSIYLVLPGTPSRSNFMAFDGFIELPRGGALNVLDYLTLHGRTLFVTSESSGALFKVDLNLKNLSASTVATMPGGGAAHDVALLPGDNAAFLTRSEENMVEAFNPQTLQRVQSIPVAEDADAILYVPSANLLYVANGDSRLATLIDPSTRSIVGDIQLPGKPEFAAIDAQTGLLYQNLEDTNAIVAIDPGKRSIAGQWSLSPCVGPSSMVIDAALRRLYSVCSGNATLVVFDVDTHRVATFLKIGGGPDSVALDPILQRIYVAGRAGKLTIIQRDGPNNYRVLDEIRTHYGAHTLALDPVSHKVFVAYASLLAHPRIAVFSPVL